MNTEQSKAVSRNVSFSRGIFDRKVRKSGVSIVVDYTDTGFGIVIDQADTNFSRISSQKRKSSRNYFRLFIWGPSRIFKQKKNGQKSRDTVPLKPNSSSKGANIICSFCKYKNLKISIHFQKWSGSH